MLLFVWIHDANYSLPQQNLDNCYPPVRFPPSIKSNIAFSSLPEGDLPSLSPSSSSSLAETGYRYHWRIPYPSEGELREAEEEEERKGGGRREMWRLPKRREEEDGGEDGDGALHGFVWFVQEKVRFFPFLVSPSRPPFPGRTDEIPSLVRAQDPSLRRLYSQRSLVLITHLPSFPGLFSSALSIIAPLHFKHARQTGGGAKGGMVESGCYNIGAWCVLIRSLVWALYSRQSSTSFVRRDSRSCPSKIDPLLSRITGPTQPPVQPSTSPSSAQS